MPPCKRKSGESEAISARDQGTEFSQPGLCSLMRLRLSYTATGRLVGRFEEALKAL